MMYYICAAPPPYEVVVGLQPSAPSASALEGGASVNNEQTTVRTLIPNSAEDVRTTTEELSTEWNCLIENVLNSELDRSSRENPPSHP
jgi:hypothetical protein